MTLKVLIADDSATIQKIVTLAFGCEDAIVECISEGGFALDAIRSFMPDVVLADIFMPGCNGYEICERVKQDAELTDIPVVLLTGAFEPFDETEASRVKSDGHLTKPFDTSELIETVLSLVENRVKSQMSGTSVETAGMEMQNNATSTSETPREFRIPAHSQVWDSYLGADRILDLFDTEMVREAEALKSLKNRRATGSSESRIAKGTEPLHAGGELSEDAINLIVDRVVKRISPDVIREVAWEVVPELSENIIRRTIEEQHKL